MRRSTVHFCFQRQGPLSKIYLINLCFRSCRRHLNIYRRTESCRKTTFSFPWDTISWKGLVESKISRWISEKRKHKCCFFISGVKYLMPLKERKVPPPLPYFTIFLDWEKALILNQKLQLQLGQAQMFNS